MKNLLILIFISLATSTVAQELTVKEFSKRASDTTDSVVVIDLRTPDELKDGVIAGAIFMDYFQKNFPAKIKKLPKKNITYLLYCASGGRSSETLELMKASGFEQVYHLGGGFSEWKSSGNPVSPYRRE